MKRWVLEAWVRQAGECLGFALLLIMGGCERTGANDAEHRTRVALMSIRDAWTSACIDGGACECSDFDELGDLLFSVGALRPHSEIYHVDAWGREYRLEMHGSTEERSYSLSSAGPDGIWDTADDLAVEVPLPAIEPDTSTRPGSKGRLTAVAAEERIKSWLAERGTLMSSDERDAPATEWGANEVWDRLGVQVFKVYMQGYLLATERVVPLGNSFGGFGLVSLCVSDLDADCEPELLFTYSWGSGVHRSEVAAWCANWPEPGFVAARVCYAGFPDWVVERRTDQDVRLRVGDHTVGRLKLESVDEQPVLRIVVEPDLSRDMREELWDYDE